MPKRTFSHINDEDSQYLNSKLITKKQRVEE